LFLLLGSPSVSEKTIPSRVKTSTPRRALDGPVFPDIENSAEKAERKVKDMEEIKELARQILETADLAIMNEEETPETFDNIIATAEKIIELSKPPF
jgi:hypothetical protein